MKMDKNKEFPIRKKNRLQNYNYRSCGVYFITLCTDKRRPILSRIVGDDVLGGPYNKTPDRFYSVGDLSFYPIKLKRLFFKCS